MTIVTMAMVITLISTVTTGIPLEDHTRTRSGLTLNERLFRTSPTALPTDRYTSQRQRQTSGDERILSEKALSQVMEYINSGRTGSKSEKPEKTYPDHADNVTENEMGQMPQRVRRTTRCQRQTDEELMSLLQSIGGVNTRYIDQSHHRFISLIPISTNEEINKLTKLEIEAVLRSNHSENSSESHPHLHTIRSSLVTPEEANVQRVRRSIIGTTVSTFCVTSGQETNRGSMRLCDTCPATTTLSDDFFPRYVNEAVCSSNTECLSGGGRCNERLLNLTVLRRTEHCSVAASSTGSQIYYVEDWEPTVQSVRVACECDVRVESLFAQYV